MTDRSAIMRAVKSKDTTPELLIRRLVFSLGFRYRLHRADLPGTPDLTFASRRAVIFVHGCFWHQHTCKRGNRQPATNVAYWRRKLARNVARDKATAQRLRGLGWRVLTVWECQTKSDRISQRLARFLTREPNARRALS
jgi:DNA mismatch endonuclease, patch repair protein